MFFFIAVATLILVLAANQFLSIPLQTSLGIWGVAATELTYAIIALCGCCAMIFWAQKKKVDGIDCIEIFSLRRPQIRHCFGGLLLMAAAFLASTLYTNIIYVLFPEQLNATAESLQNLLMADNLPVMIVIMAVFPAICEEVVFRGVTYYTFERFGTARIAILLSGIIFGLFHIDPIRIPITIGMGIALAYACWRSKSIFVPMLMHFCNNAYSAVISALSSQLTSELTEEAENAYSILEQQGISQSILSIVSGGELFVMILGLLIGGFALLESRPVEALKKHKVTAVVLAAALVLLTGGYIAATLSA